MIPHCIFSTSAFSNNMVTCLLATTLCVCSIGLAQASEKTQTFISEWTVNPWNYHGDTAATDWHYIKYEPWDRALGELREVRVQTDILGEHESQSEDVRIRSAFFKGWSPANYQLATRSYIPIGDKEFLTSMSFIYNSPQELEPWLNTDTTAPSHYYFESRTVKAGHKISAVTTLTFIYDSLPDQLVLELADLVLNYEESSALSVDTTNVLLRNLNKVMTHIDQDNVQQACDGLITFNRATEESASKGGIEYSASVLLITEADQIMTDLSCAYM